MKKQILFITLLLCSVSGICHAQVVVPDTLITPIIFSPFPPGPNNPDSPVIGETIELSGGYNAEELTVSITDYWGDMDVLILGPWHTQMYSDSVAVSGSETLNIDISSYASGIYYIYILVDDEWYEGEFEIEL